MFWRYYSIQKVSKISKYEYPKYPKINIQKYPKSIQKSYQSIQNDQKVSKNWVSKSIKKYPKVIRTWVSKSIQKISIQNARKLVNWIASQSKRQNWHTISNTLQQDTNNWKESQANCHTTDRLFQWVYNLSPVDLQAFPYGFASLSLWIYTPSPTGLQAFPYGFPNRSLWCTFIYWFLYVWQMSVPPSDTLLFSWLRPPSHLRANA